MPQIGWLEILIVVSIAIIVVGPKDFPKMVKKIGSWIGSVKRYASNIQNEVASIENDTNNINDNSKNKTEQKVNLGEKKDG
mgnify:FL=1|tara:strand:+ start:50 stop:292 length:243 start_codon:yes stop_codon:yes gene_type:complete